MQAYPFADLFSAFGGIGVPHNTELNPIIKGNHISALKTEVKVPQVEKLNAAETMAKLFEWQTQPRAAMLKTHPPINLKAAFMCNDIEIPILVIDDNEKAAVIRRSNDNNLNNKYSDFDWANYPKVSDIGVKSRFGYRTTLGDVLAEVSRPKPSSKPLQYAPTATLTQGGQNHELTNEPPAVDHVDNNSLMFNDKYDEQFTAGAYTPCTSSLCNGQQVYNRSSFPVFNVQFFQ